MKLGVLSGVFRGVDYHDVAGRARLNGMEAIHFQFRSFPELGIKRAGRLSTGLANEIADQFIRHGVRIPALGCYINLVDVNETERREGIALFKEHLRYARDFGASVVTTETGTLSPDSPWGSHPANQNAASWDALKSVLYELVEEAEKWGVFVGLEGYFNHVIDTPERMERMLGELGSSHLGVVMDPCNYIHGRNAERADEVIEDAFRRLGPHILIAHAKDYDVDGGGTLTQQEPIAGTGKLNYPLYLELLERNKPSCYLCLEHLNEHELPKSAALIRQAMPR